MCFKQRINAKIRLAVGNERRLEAGKPAKGHLQWARWKFLTKELEGLKRGGRNLCEMKNTSSCGWSFFVHFRIKMVSDFWLRQLSGWWHLNTHERVEMSVFYSRESIIAYKI